MVHIFNSTGMQFWNGVYAHRYAYFAYAYLLHIYLTPILFLFLPFSSNKKVSVKNGMRRLVPTTVLTNWFLEVHLS